jgi:hypothetical protein
MMRVALGVLVVLVDIGWQAWDVVPDPLGWALVLSGVLPLVNHLGRRVASTAVLALVVSLVVYPPPVGRDVDPVVGWLISLPQLTFVAALCLSLAPLVPRATRRLARTAAALVALSVAPLGVLLTGRSELLFVVGFLVVSLQLYAVYLVVRVADALPTSSGEAGADSRGGPPPDAGHHSA